MNGLLAMEKSRPAWMPGLAGCESPPGRPRSWRSRPPAPSRRRRSARIATRRRTGRWPRGCLASRLWRCARGYRRRSRRKEVALEPPWRHQADSFGASVSVHATLTRSPGAARCSCAGFSERRTHVALAVRRCSSNKDESQAGDEEEHLYTAHEDHADSTPCGATRAVA